MEPVIVIVATFGGRDWADRGLDLAAKVERDHREPAIACHAPTLAAARNLGASKARTEWLCFLDADDDLEPGYLEHLLAAPVGDLRAPALAFDDNPPETLEARPSMAVMNQCVIGTLIRRDLFHAAGGFWEEPIYEDWSLFRRAWLLGASIVHVPAAIYRSRTSPSGRNLSHDQAWRSRQARQIIDTTNAWHAGNPPTWKASAR